MNPVTQPFLQLPLFSMDAGAGKNCRVKEPPPPGKLSRGAERLVSLLRWYGEQYRRVYPMQARLAAHLEVTGRQLRRYIRELVDALLLRVQKCGRHAAEYELAVEAVAEKNVRSKSGRSPVEVRSKPSGPLSNISLHLHSARAEKTTQPERKPPAREEGKIERIVAYLKANYGEQRL